MKEIHKYTNSIANKKKHVKKKKSLRKLKPTNKNKLS